MSCPKRTKKIMSPLGIFFVVERAGVWGGMHGSTICSGKLEVQGVDYFFPSKTIKNVSSY